VRTQLTRRSLVSSYETGGQAHCKTGYALFSKHPGWYRYLGFLIMVQAYIPTMIFWNDNNFNERKLEVSILDAIFSEDNFFHDLNLTVVSFTYGWFAWFTGRCMFFHSMNMWNN